jgi:hypothetical protein
MDTSASLSKATTEADKEQYKRKDGASSAERRDMSLVDAQRSPFHPNPVQPSSPLQFQQKK